MATICSTTRSINLVPLIGILEIINRPPLLSVQKTALAETLKKAFNSAPIETQEIPPAKENESDLLGKIRKSF